MAKKMIGILAIFSLYSLSCGSPPPPIESVDFGAYWNQGKAEITSYTLQQARYGEIHEGTAVLIYVTEEFSEKKHVKLDNPKASSSSVPILKLNSTRKFNTGLYEYSMMTSVFKPVSGDETLKITCTSQDWCGHTFTQFNKNQEGYQVKQFSYFESEGDISKKISTDQTEDDLWVQLRVNPTEIKSGRTKMIPSLFYLRFSHNPIKEYTAEIKNDLENGELNLEYPELNRSVKIQYNVVFPYEIEGWQETYISGWGDSAKELTTKATKKKTLKTAYWKKHDNSDSHLRKELEIE